MTFEDAWAVERYVAELCHSYGIGALPVMKPVRYDRVDVDLTYCPLRRDLVQDWLARALGRRGYAWDVWFLDGTCDTLCVSEKEEG